MKKYLLIFRECLISMLSRYSFIYIYLKKKNQYFEPIQINFKENFKRQQLTGQDHKKTISPSSIPYSYYFLPQIILRIRLFFMSYRLSQLQVLLKNKFRKKAELDKSPKLFLCEGCQQNSAIYQEKSIFPVRETIIPKHFILA